MGAQIIPEGDMALNFGRVRCEEVKLRQANARLVIEAAITSSWKTKFAAPPIAERLHDPPLPVEVSQTGHDGHEINDRLGGQPPHRRRADVMDRNEDRTELLQTFGVFGRHSRPIGIIRDENDGSRHAQTLRIDTRRFKLEQSPYACAALNRERALRRFAFVDIPRSEAAFLDIGAHVFYL
jgi:hypothetical protein